MRDVAPGNLVFSFADTRIRAFGIARSHAFEASKPLEFGSAGRNWDEIGWRVEVSFQEVATHFRPADWIEVLRPLLPAKYSPLLPDGRGRSHWDWLLGLCSSEGAEGDRRVADDVGKPPASAGRCAWPHARVGARGRPAEP
jgi:hypothetical protein